MLDLCMENDFVIAMLTLIIHYQCTRYQCSYNVA